MRPALSAALPVLLALSAPMAAPAAAAGRDFWSISGMHVVADGPQSFSVINDGFPSEDRIWCAAADYVLNGLRLPARTRIWVLSPIPRPRGQGMRFSLSPEGAQPRTGVTIFGDDGPANSISAAAAESFCHDLVPFFHDP